MSVASRVLSAMERAKLVCWLEETASPAMVARRYRAEFGMEPPKMSQIKKWHSEFMKTGSVFGETATPSSQQLASHEAARLSSERFLGPRL
ncbi:hypothetical protein AAVH_04572 [Aphelenchoides avenae]|nr:hypothetical protein AAVH_04572 [Aphelenchus avenae]